MVSITTWTRLEPRSRGDDLAPSLEARVHDPAWLLGRQWQLGEFVGEDAGTPVLVQLEVRPEPIVAYRVGAADAAFDLGVPIDALVGAEPRGAPTLTERAEAGVELLDLLAEAGCSAAGAAALVGTALLPAPTGHRFGSDGEPLLALAAGRLPDGGALEPLLAVIAAAGAIPAAAAVGLSAADASAVVSAAQAWVAWRATLVRTAPASGWVDEQLEHQFALGVAPPGAPAYTLAAPSWDGARLDWYDLDIDPQRTPPARPAAAPVPQRMPGADADGLVRRTGVPVALAYPGMPSARWWEFEDARVNLAQIAAQPEDLARMLVVEFASVYGNDWYLWPLVLPVGAVHRISRFDVLDTFGDVIDVKAAGSAVGGTGQSEWQMFRPTLRKPGGDTAGDGLVLLPTLASALDGEVFEDVLYLRDELANLAWAIETTVRGEDGLPFDRHSDAAATGGLPGAGRAVTGAAGAPLQWHFATDVPVYWFPLAPDPAGTPRFQRLVLRRVDADGTVSDVLPAGELLSADHPWLWQEEVPREGARTTRRHHMARGEDGRLHVWTGRRVEVGRGEGSSGLRYDEALPGTDGG